MSEEFQGDNSPYGERTITSLSNNGGHYVFERLVRKKHRWDLVECDSSNKFTRKQYICFLQQGSILRSVVWRITFCAQPTWRAERRKWRSGLLCFHVCIAFLSRKTSADFHNMVNTCCDIDCASQRTSKIVTFNRIQTINTTESTS